MSDDVTITIDRKEWRWWNEMELHLSLDSHPTVGFVAPFEPERREFRDAFRPFSFKPIEVHVDGERIFTGNLVGVEPHVDAASRTVQASAYSKAAVLADCCPPPGLAPVEANGLTLRQIAERLAAPFGVNVVMNAADGAPFKRVKSKQRDSNNKAEQDQDIENFLADLARQRGLVISSDQDGDLLFQRSVQTGNPVVRFEEGVPPLLSVTPTFSPQSYFDEVTGFVAAKRGRVGSQYTQRVNRLSGGPLRTFSFSLQDVEKADGPAAVRAKVGRMLGNVYTCVVSVPTWRDPNGSLWRANTTAVVKAPSAFVLNDFEFIVRDVYLKRRAGEMTASLGLVLPGAFSGEQPASMPWDEA